MIYYKFSLICFSFDLTKMYYELNVLFIIKKNIYKIGFFYFEFSLIDRNIISITIINIKKVMTSKIYLSTFKIMQVLILNYFNLLRV